MFKGYSTLTRLCFQGDFGGKIRSKVLHENICNAEAHCVKVVGLLCLCGWTSDSADAVESCVLCGWGSTEAEYCLGMAWRWTSPYHVCWPKRPESWDGVVWRSENMDLRKFIEGARPCWNATHFHRWLAAAESTRDGWGDQSESSRAVEDLLGSFRWPWSGVSPKLWWGFLMVPVGLKRMELNLRHLSAIYCGTTLSGVSMDMMLTYWIILVQEQRWYSMLAFNDKGLLPFFPDCQLLKYCQTKRPVTVPIKTVFLVCHEGHCGRWQRLNHQQMLHQNVWEIQVL